MRRLLRRMRIYLDRGHCTYCMRYLPPFRVPYGNEHGSLFCSKDCEQRWKEL